MRRSQTLRHQTRASMPAANNVLGKLAPVDDLGVLHETDRASGLDSRNATMDGLEARLRGEIFEKERVNDKLQEQILSLQTQLAQRPPLSTIQELQNEKSALELILQGTQRENEKMMISLERGQTRQRLLESELHKLCGDNWQTSLNIPSSESPSLKAPPMAQSSFVGNAAFAASTLSLTPSHLASSTRPSAQHRRSQSAVLSRSIVQGSSRGVPTSMRIQEDNVDVPAADSSYLTAPDRTHAHVGGVGSDSDASSDGDDADSAEVDDALSTSPKGTRSRRELDLELKNQLLQQQIEQVKLLVLGLDKRMSEREEVLNKTEERAEKEGRGLTGQLRELDLGHGQA